MVDDVFWFEIAVYDLALVHVVKCSADLLKDVFGQSLRQLAFAFQQGVELS